MLICLILFGLLSGINLGYFVNELICFKVGNSI